MQTVECYCTSKQKKIGRKSDCSLNPVLTTRFLCTTTPQNNSSSSSSSSSSSNKQQSKGVDLWRPNNLLCCHMFLLPPMHSHAFWLLLLLLLLLLSLPLLLVNEWGCTQYHGLDWGWFSHQITTTTKQQISNPSFSSSLLVTEHVVCAQEAELFLQGFPTLPPPLPNWGTFLGLCPLVMKLQIELSVFHWNILQLNSKNESRPLDGPVNLSYPFNPVVHI